MRDPSGLQNTIWHGRHYQGGAILKVYTMYQKLVNDKIAFTKRSSPGDNTREGGYHPCEIMSCGKDRLMDTS